MRVRLAPRAASVLALLMGMALLILPAPAASAADSGGTAISLSSGGYTSCVITPNLRLKCWGGNDYSQMGLGGDISDHATPVLIPGLKNVKQVSMDRYHTCAIRGSSRQLFCWGDNEFGQVGDGTTDSRTSPVKVIDSGVKQVDVGLDHTCAVLSNGKAKCWGNNLEGQLGDGTTDQRLTPTLVSRLKNVRSISAGEYYSCATTAGSVARCWGSNGYGQLGTGDDLPRLRPTAVTGLNTNVQRVKGEDYTTCATVGDGRLKCWGNNSEGTLGNGEYGGYSTTPVNVLGMDRGVTSFDVSYDIACAVKANTTKCWGWNRYNQLGNGDTDNRNRPTLVAGLKGNTVEVQTAEYHACARLKNGAVRCWGYNSSGQIGNGDLVTEQFATPQKVLL